MFLATRKPRYPKTKFVLAIDIGTTYTAASYCTFSGKDNEPSFQEINRWPKQTFADAKIPSVLYYDHLKVARLHGAETEDEDSLLEAEIGKWKKAEWWKLLLRPDYLAMPSGFSVSPLPPGVTVDDVFRDQLVYVKENVRQFIIKAYCDGEKTWEEFSSSLYIILTTPNGWEGKHQNRMREAAVSAGLITAHDRHRVRFVSEGEAGIHYALDHGGKARDWVEVGGNVLVCDAGGGTTDIGVYKVRSLSPIFLEEITRPGCFIAGGVFVNEAAKIFITGQLRGTQWDTPEYIASAMKDFEKNAKRRFKGTESSFLIRLDGSSKSNEARGIVRGRLKIPCSRMISFFNPLITIIIQGLEETLLAGPWAIDKIIVVGGFAESEYVFSELKSWAAKKGLPIGKPDGVLSKAIAHGALSWHLHSAVQLRIAKLHYGAETDMKFCSDDPDMSYRRSFKNILGEWRVRDAWNAIVSKDKRLRAGEEHSAWFHHEFGDNESLTVKLDLYAYRWSNPPVFFKTVDGHLVDGFIHVGTVKGDLTNCFNATSYLISPTGRKYKKLQYEVCLSFDEIEIQARLRWKEGRTTRYGEAIMAYDV